MGTAAAQGAQASGCRSRECRCSTECFQRAGVFRRFRSLKALLFERGDDNNGPTFRRYGQYPEDVPPKWPFLTTCVP